MNVNGSASCRGRQRTSSSSTATTAISDSAGSASARSRIVTVGSRFIASGAPIETPKMRCPASPVSIVRQASSRWRHARNARPRLPTASAHASTAGCRRSRPGSDHHEPRHGEMPGMQHIYSDRGCRAADRCAAPVVLRLVDEAEAQPDRIVEIDARDAPRIGGFVEDAVGGKGEGAVGPPLRQQPPAALVAADSSRRTPPTAGERHPPAAPFQRAAAASAEHVVSFVDPRRWPDQLPSIVERDDAERAATQAAQPVRHAAAKIGTAASSRSR